MNRVRRFARFQRKALHFKIGRQFFALSIIVLLLFVVHYGLAGPLAAGDPDTFFAGFAGNGRVQYSDMELVDFAPYLDQGWVVLGQQNNQLSVRRYDYDGIQDSTFGMGGVATFLTDGAPCGEEEVFKACGIAAYADGKIIVVGATRVGGDHDYLAFRLNANGTLDTSFGQNGSRTIDFDGGDDAAADVAIQDDGKAVIVGAATDVDPLGADDWEFGTVRLTQGGNLDSSFSGDGRATASWGTGYLGRGAHWATSVAIQPDGRIVVAGQADDSHEVIASLLDFDFGLVRYNSDGTLDNSFSGNGMVKTGFDAWEAAYDVYLQPDGKIVAAGRRVNNGNLRVALARYNVDGTLDDTFSDNGKLHANLGFDDALAVAIVGQPDRKLLVLGVVNDAGTVIARFNEDGTLDNSFSGDGIYHLLESQIARDLALQVDGKMVVGTHGAFARYRPNLTLDGAGTNVTGFGYGDDRGYGVVRYIDGSYFVASEFHSPLFSNGLDVALTRYRADGQLDRSFGQNGRSAFELINDDAARDILLLPGGKIAVAGFRHHTINDDFALWRFNADGSPDGAFGGGGFAVTGFGIGADYGQAAVAQPGGKIVVAGFSENDSGRFLTMARFDADGNLDSSFADNGKFVEARGQDYFSLRALTRLPDGDLLAVGGRAGDFWAYRFTADGVPDTAFGNNGYQEYALIGNDEAQTVDVLPSGVIVIGGYAGGDYGLLFINEDGSMCLEFCGFFDESRMRIDFGADEVAYDMAIQSNGRIIVAGSVRDISSSHSGFLLARVFFTSFPTRGFQLDTSFGTNGKLAVPFLNGARPRDIMLHDDKIVLVGLTRNGADDDIALARLLNDHTEATPFHDAFLPLIRN